MNLTKFDLYNSEWLEVVFNNRNKEYGAYDLRKHYAGNLSKAMAISFFGVAVAIALVSNLHRPAPVAPLIAQDPLIQIVPVVLDPKVQPPKAATLPKLSSAPTISNPPMVVAPDADETHAVTIAEFKDKIISSVTSSGTDGGDIVIPDVNPGSAGNAAAGSGDNTIVDAGSLEIMPEPFGGPAAWAKFLQKHIHYPPQATDANVQGKVLLSFIIETDGHLSNIQVERGAGFGLDQEALRVLKLAPAWKPGIQNGHPVRVKYTIPISFTLSDPD